MSNKDLILLWQGIDPVARTAFLITNGSTDLVTGVTINSNLVASTNIHPLVNILGYRFDNPTSQSFSGWRFGLGFQNTGIGDQEGLFLSADTFNGLDFEKLASITPRIFNQNFGNGTLNLNQRIFFASGIIDFSASSGNGFSAVELTFSQNMMNYIGNGGNRPISGHLLIYSPPSITLNTTSIDAGDNLTALRAAMDAWVSDGGTRWSDSVFQTSGPSITADAGSDQRVCNVTTATLTAINPTPNSGSWSYLSGPNTPTITTPNSYSTNVTGLVAGTYTFKWTVTNGPNSASDTMVLNVSRLSISDMVLTPSRVCAGQSYTASWANIVQNGGTQANVRIRVNNSDYTATQPIAGGSLVLPGINIASDYLVTLTVVDATYPACSDVRTKILSVSSIAISDLRGGPVCVDSLFDVSFNVAVQNGGLARTTLNWNGSDYRSDFTPGNRSFRVPAPSVAGDYRATLTVQDTLNLSCSDVKTTTIKVSKATASNLSGGPVCVDSMFDVSFTVDVQNGGLARTTLTWNGSDYRSDFVSGTHAFHVQAPSVGSDYQAVLKVQDTLNLSCSDVKTTTIKVIKFALSDITLTPNPVCKDQPYTVSWANIAQNGGTQANVTININGNDHTTQQSIGGGSLSLPAIGVASDYVVTVTVADSTYPFCSDVKTKTLSVQEVAVDAGPDREIVFGHSTQLGIGTPAPKVSYSWTPTTGLNDPNILNPISTPVTDGYTTYTVVASRTDVSDCVASDSVTIFACHLQLSDIQFTGLGQTGFSISGAQFSNKNTTRIVEVTYLGDTHQQVFTGNGTFMDSFTGITIVDGAPITIHAYHSDTPACSDTKTAITSIQNNQGVVGFQLVGSALAFDLALSPEATAALLPPTSDIHEALDRLCDYIAGQNPQRTIGVLIITNQSDVFAPNSAILNGDHAVFIRCSDDHMIFDEVQGGFHLDFSPYLSDNLTVVYSDTVSSVTKGMIVSGGGFSLTFDNQKFVEISACFSDFPRIGLTDYIDCTLVSADVNSPVKGVDQIGCIPVCYNRTSDVNYVCQLIACEEQVEHYLSQHFSGYTFSDKCNVTYTGNLIADELRIDLNTCMMLMSRIHMPICSDAGIC